MADDPFRAALREWLRATLSAVWGGDLAPVGLSEDDELDLRLRFDREVFLAGWAGISWPADYGGRGGTQAQEVVFAEECAALGAPERYNRVAIGIAAPALLGFGSEAQRRRYLPKMLDCEEVWCQGFSEPNAGSDLAGLAARAEPDGAGGWRITGQKIWTTLADRAQLGFLLARTSVERSRHQGITAFIVPMRQPGITIRPIRQINDSREFSEVFLDGAVPEGVIGAVGQGWEVAMHALGFERSTNLAHRQIRLGLRLEAVLDQVRARPDAVPDAVKERLLTLCVRVEALRHTVRAHLVQIERDGTVGYGNNATKVYWSDAFQELGDLALEVGGLEGFLGAGVEGREAADLYLASRAATIYAGTSEIQKNIIAERGLGLPR